MRFIAILAVVLLCGSAHAELRRYAVIVGANAGDRGEVELRYAQSDARRLAEVLRSVGGVHAEDLTLLGDPSAEELRRALLNVNARIRQETTEAMLIVFYSGHADAERLHVGGGGLPLGELRAMVAGSAARARLLVLDACRSGALTRVKGGRRVPAFDVRVDAPEGAEGLALLTSSAAGEDSEESDQLGASFFSLYFTSALMGAADVDGDGAVTLGEAFRYAAERTLQATASTVAGPQHPTYRFDVGGRDDLVLTRPGGSSVGRLRFVEPGWYLVSRVRGPAVAELRAESAGRELALPPGRYQVTQRAPDFLREGQLDVAASSTTMVQPAQLARIDYARVVRKGGNIRRGAWSATALAGVRGDLAGLGTAWQVVPGVRLDLRSVSLELRLAVGQSEETDRGFKAQTTEIGPSLQAVRALDLGPVTLAAGAHVGLSVLQQGFSQYVVAPPRAATAFTFGLVGQAQAALGRRVYAQLEAGFIEYVVDLQTSPTAHGARALPSWTVRAGLGLYL